MKSEVRGGKELHSVGRYKARMAEHLDDEEELRSHKRARRSEVGL